MNTSIEVPHDFVGIQCRHGRYFNDPRDVLLPGRHSTPNPVHLIQIKGIAQVRLDPGLIYPHLEVAYEVEPRRVVDLIRLFDLMVQDPGSLAELVHEGAEAIHRGELRTAGFDGLLRLSEQGLQAFLKECSRKLEVFFDHVSPERMKPGAFTRTCFRFRNVGGSVRAASGLC